MLSRAKYSLLCFFLGGLYGWIGDGGHVYTRVLEYRRHERFWWPGLAWWVLPQFAVGGLVLSLLVRHMMLRTLQRNPRYMPSGDFPSYGFGCMCVLGSLLTYLLSSVLSERRMPQRDISFSLLACTLLLAVPLRLFRSDRALPFSIMAWVVNFAGIGYESTLCALGWFKYTEPDKYLYVNHWIGFLWVGAVWSAVFPMWRYEWHRQHPKFREQAIAAQLEADERRAAAKRAAGHKAQLARDAAEKAAAELRAVTGAATSDNNKRRGSLSGSEPNSGSKKKKKESGAKKRSAAAKQ